MKIWDKIVGAAKTDLYCSFCSSPRAAVGYLVAGPEVYICDRCIALCVAVVDGAKLEKGETQLWTIYRTLPALAEGLQPDVRDANADRLLDIAEAIVRSDAEMLRWAATLARYLGRSQRSRALLLRIDAGARDREAALDLAASCFDLGQFDEAREAIESLPAGPEVDAARLLIRLRARGIEAPGDES